MKYSNKKNLAIRVKGEKITIKGKDVSLVACIERIAELQRALDDFKIGMTVKTTKKNLLAYDVFNAKIVKTGDDAYALVGKTKVTLLDAVERNFNDLAIKLIQGGAKIDVRNRFGFELLHIAAKSGKLQLAKCLLENGAHVNTLSQDGNLGIPLMYAARSRNKKMVKLLLDNGADANKLSRQGTSALEYLSVLANKPVSKNIAEDMVEIADMLSKAQGSKKSNLIGPILYLQSYQNEVAKNMLNAINKNIENRQAEIRKIEEERNRIVKEVDELSGYKINILN